MTHDQIASLEHAGRTAMGWAPEFDAGHETTGMLIKALVPALGILAVAAAILFALN